MDGDRGDLAEFEKKYICGRKMIRVKLRYVMIIAGIEWTEMDEDRSHGATSTSSTAIGGEGTTGVQVKEEKEDKDVDHFLMHF